MLESIGEVFLQRKRNPLDGTDIRILIEQWLRQEMRSEQIYCVAVQGGKATVRVGSPLLYQEITVRQHELSEVLMSQAEYALKHVTLVAAYL